MHPRLAANVYRSQRRIRRDKALDRADTLALVLGLCGIAAVAIAGWL